MKKQKERIGQPPPPEHIETDTRSGQNLLEKWYDRKRPRNTSVFYSPWIARAIITTGFVGGAALGWPHNHGFLSESPELDEMFMGATLLGVASLIPAIPFMKNYLAEAVDNKLEKDPLWGPVIREQQAAKEQRKKTCESSFDE